ncbi:MAG: HNH endonuclease [Planctomycetes bacterium]|nr:HNH endonuclease [Planctomycetota bacterium]
MSTARRVLWSRAHSLIALNLYCKLPFGKLHKGNPLIKEVSALMGRTPSSLAMKLCNFASLDPVLRARGIKGLPQVSNNDKAIWSEFHRDIETLAPESEQLLHRLFTDNDDLEIDLLERDRVRFEPTQRIPSGMRVTEATATTRVRRGQQFFRQSILNAYGVRCCISGINVPRLLIASHIKPWNAFPDERLNPKNGLCLSSIHDAAFDSGLITLDEEWCVVVSKSIKKYLPQSMLQRCIVRYHGKPIRMPEMLAMPDQHFLGYHREKIFIS